MRSGRDGATMGKKGVELVVKRLWLGSLCKFLFEGICDEKTSFSPKSAKRYFFLKLSPQGWLVGGNSPSLNLVLDGVFILIYRPNGPVLCDGRFCFCNGDYLVLASGNSITRFDWIHRVVRGIISGRDNDLLYPEICISQSVAISRLKRFQITVSLKMAANWKPAHLKLLTNVIVLILMFHKAI